MMSSWKGGDKPVHAVDQGSVNSWPIERSYLLSDLRAGWDSKSSLRGERQVGEKIEIKTY